VTRCFWTARTIALHTGEKILTDGKTTIRERCGNVLTVEPLGPALMDEPAAPEFDVRGHAVDRAGAATGWTHRRLLLIRLTRQILRGSTVPVVYRVDPPVPVPEPATWVLRRWGWMAVLPRSLHTRRAQSQR
jgi:hypothetical protein